MVLFGALDWADGRRRFLATSPAVLVRSPSHMSRSFSSSSHTGQEVSFGIESVVFGFANSFTFGLGLVMIASLQRIKKIRAQLMTSDGVVSANAVISHKDVFIQRGKGGSETKYCNVSYTFSAKKYNGTAFRVTMTSELISEANWNKCAPGMIFPVRCLEREPRRCVLQMTAEEAPPPGPLTLQAIGIAMVVFSVVGGTLFPILAEELVFVVAGIITFYLFALPMLIPFYRAITLEHTFFLGLDTLAKFEFNEFHMPFNFTGPGSRVDIEEIPASEVEKSRREGKEVVPVVAAQPIVVMAVAMPVTEATPLAVATATAV